MARRIKGLKLASLINTLNMHSAAERTLYGRQYADRVSGYIFPLFIFYKFR